MDKYLLINELSNLKIMINNSAKKYSERIAYKLKDDKNYVVYSYNDVLRMVNSLGTALIDLGLKDKKIAVIGENRYEWEIAYLATVCGVGIAVPLDKSLPLNELESLVERSEVEAIFYSEKYKENIDNIRENGIGKLKYFISMDQCQNHDNIFSECELIKKGKSLIENGNNLFLNSNVAKNDVSVLLFTSGTTSASKVVALSQANIVSNLNDLLDILDISEEDIFLSFLPLHHVFECTVGFLLPLSRGSQIVFADGMRHITENINEYKISVMASVPAIYEKIYKDIWRKIINDGNEEMIRNEISETKNCSMTEKERKFKGIHNMLGGNIKLLISGAAALNKEIEQGYRDFGINLVQGYGLTETSPVVGMGTNKESKVGSIGKCLPSQNVKINNPDENGIGELIVKGPNVMIGYYKDEIATSDVIKDGWFYTGDLAKIDKEGYIFICGRKKNVLVLKNGKNIFPEELECLINKIDGVQESLVFGKMNLNDKNDIKINAKIIYDKQYFKLEKKINSESEIYDYIFSEIKNLNKLIPRYKNIKNIILSEIPLIKTTTNKIKRQEEMKILLCS